MALVRQKFREIVLQLLYSKIFVIQDEKNLVSFMMQQIKTTKTNILIALEYVKKILTYVEQFDEKIKQVSVSYDIKRISKVELSVLRLAMYEFKYENIPFKVALTEAMRLTKKFSTKSSINFVNAVLNNIYHQENADISK